MVGLNDNEPAEGGMTDHNIGVIRRPRRGEIRTVLCCTMS